MPTPDHVLLAAASIPEMGQNLVAWGVTFLASLAVAIGLYLVVRAAVKSHGALGAIVAAAVAAIALLVVVRLLTSGQGAKTGEETVKFFEIAVPPGAFRALAGWILGA